MKINKYGLSYYCVTEGKVYFSLPDSNLVFSVLWLGGRSKYDIRYEWKILGLTPCKQPESDWERIIASVNPEDMHFEVEATLAMLKCELYTMIEQRLGKWKGLMAMKL